jgi:hypothetical protein
MVVLTCASLTGATRLVSRASLRPHFRVSTVASEKHVDAGTSSRDSPHLKICFTRRTWALT